MPSLRAFHIPLLAVSSFFIAASAHAFSVSNIDGVPHRVQVTRSPGQQSYVVEIPPSRTVDLGRIPSDLKLLTGQQSAITQARDFNEYVIWPGGKMYIQQRRKIRGTTNY